LTVGTAFLKLVRYIKKDEGCRAKPVRSRMKDEKLVNGSFLPSAFCLLPLILSPLISGDRLYLTWQGNAVYLTNDAIALILGFNP